MSLLLYLVGFVVFIAGLACLATMAGISQTLILAAAGLLLGIGIITAIVRARMTEPVA